MHTNQTAHYNLPQFLASDKATWLNDVNTAFFDIDAQMFQNSQSAETGINTASNAIAKTDSLQKNIEGLTSLIDTITNDVSSAGNSIETITQQVNTINESIETLQRMNVGWSSDFRGFLDGYLQTIKLGSMIKPNTFPGCGEAIGERLKTIEGQITTINNSLQSFTPEWREAEVNVSKEPVKCYCANKFISLNIGMKTINNAEQSLGISLSMLNDLYPHLTSFTLENDNDIFPAYDPISYACTGYFQLSSDRWEGNMLMFNLIYNGSTFGSAKFTNLSNIYLGNNIN